MKETQPAGMATPAHASQESFVTPAARKQFSIFCFVAAWFARLVVAGVFLYAAWGKLETKESQKHFIEEVRGYQMAPVEITNSIAYVVPWIEILAALLLILGLWRREARALLALMLVGFLVMKTIVLAQGRHIHCGCVPSTSILAPLFEGWGGWAGVLTNVVLLALLCLDALMTRRPCATTKAAPQSNTP